MAPLILHIGARSAERRGHFNPGINETRGRVNLRASEDVLKKAGVFCTCWKSKIVVREIDVQLAAKMCRK